MGNYCSKMSIRCLVYFCQNIFNFYLFGLAVVMMVMVFINSYYHNKLMTNNDKPRTFEYSSLVMGSKDIPLASFPLKRPPALTCSKGFHKKTDLLNAKYSKIKQNKVRARNERPDIFLEGQQLARVNAAWQHQVDARYFQNIREKMRRSTPNGFLKTPSHKRRTPGPRSTPTCADFEQQNSCVCILNYPKKQVNPNMRSGTIYSNRRISSSQKYTNSLKQSPTRRQYHQKLQQKIMQKAQLKLNQSAKAIEQFKRKQLFYMAQRDLSIVRSQSFIVTQYPLGQIITGYYFKKTVEIASLTKIMTFYAVIRLIKQYSVNPNEVVIAVDSKAADMSGTSAELYQGDTYTIMQLFYGMMLPSGNDAAAALARWGGKVLGGESKDFMAYMNKLAIQLGMKSSSFGNPHGLPHSQNGSTAQDVSILVGKCLQFDLFRQVIKCKKYRCWTENSGVKRQVVWQNTNKLLRRPGFQGVKTGVTVTAGPCLATLFSTAGRTFIVILLRCNKMSRRFKETRWLLKICLRRMNFDGIFSPALNQLGRQDPQLDSDNSDQQQQFLFDRNDLFQMQRRRNIIMNQT